MKKRLLNNIEMKVGAVAIAFIIWLFVMNADEPITTREIHNVPVEVINNEVIERQGKTAELIEGDKITVYVKGKRSALYKLDEEKLLATADLKKLSIVNAVPIQVTMQKGGWQVEIIKIITDTARFEIKNK